MRLFSVPADFRESTVDRYAELNSRYDNAVVEETYGQATVGVPYGSGRSSWVLPPVDLSSLGSYISYSADRGIGFNYTFNPSCLGNIEFTKAGFRQVNRFLSSLWDAGVRCLTVSLPDLMVLVRDSGYQFTVKTSTISQVNSASKAAFYKAQGIGRLVIDEDITRDFRGIRQICEVFGDGVEMIVNSICLKNCPYKMFHYNHEAHSASVRQEVKDFYSRRCIMQKSDDWTSPIRLNWVRPEDLGFYESVGVRRFKLQGRHAVIHGDPVGTTEAYMRGSFDGDLFMLLNMFDPRVDMAGYHPYIENAKLDGYLARYYEDPNFCTGDCAACGHCERYAAASIDLKRSDEMIRRLRDEYAEYRPFEGLQERPLLPRVANRLRREIGGIIRGKA